MNKFMMIDYGSKTNQRMLRIILLAFFFIASALTISADNANPYNGTWVTPDGTGKAIITDKTFEISSYHVLLSSMISGVKGTYYKYNKDTWMFKREQTYKDGKWIDDPMPEMIPEMKATYSDWKDENGKVHNEFQGEEPTGKMIPNPGESLKMSFQGKGLDIQFNEFVTGNTYESLTKTKLQEFADKLNVYKEPAEKDLGFNKYPEAVYDIDQSYSMRGENAVNYIWKSKGSLEKVIAFYEKATDKKASQSMPGNPRFVIKTEKNDGNKKFLLSIDISDLKSAIMINIEKKQINAGETTVSGEPTEKDIGFKTYPGATFNVEASSKSGGKLSYTWISTDPPNLIAAYYEKATGKKPMNLGPSYVFQFEQNVKTKKPMVMMISPMGGKMVSIIVQIDY
jgi:hypothetical protein